MTADPDLLLEQARDWLAAGKGAAIATVVETWGSAPRQAGARLVVSSEAELFGSVSGGCVEGAVAAEALEAMKDGAPRLLTYGVSDDDAFAVGLACGGVIRVLVDPVGAPEGDGMPRADLDRLIAAGAAREAIGYEISLQDWRRRFVAPAEAPEAFAADKSGLVAEGERFLALQNPPLRLAIIGAAHIAQALAPMARIAGYDVSVIDPRGAFATEARFPGLTAGETLLTDWPDAALAQHGVDARTAVVCLTHDPKLDDPALKTALGSAAFYVGALGSTRTHSKRVERLVAAGLAQDAIDRLDAPVGLDIGAKTPAEIAIAVMGAMTLALRRPGGAS
ncbi:MAG: XdhC/CoxI family protein [Neomegalonema sp.]|nr:XdhC/CoxI family protein [Neomegalonema sp.]